MASKCPSCRKSVEKVADEFPFCSKRCRAADLGAWLEGSYRIPDPEPVDGFSAEFPTERS